VAYATLNGSPILFATIGLPRVGVWHADVALSATAAITGRCTLAIDGGLTLVGTVKRSDVWLETVKLRMVAGAGGLGRLARPQHYRQTRLSVVMADLLKAAGETLASDTDSAALALSFGSWATMANPVGVMVSALLADGRLPVTTAWRMRPDGTLWFGPETWPDSGLVNVSDYQDLEEHPEDGRIELGVEAPSLLPGTVLDGRRLSYVEHVLTGDAARTRVWAEG
jgi:hypothetical protein